MNKGEFIVKFIAESAAKGMSALDAAKEEIEEIDKELHEAEKKKIRRMNLIEVLNHFGDETHRRRRNGNVPSSDDIDISSEDIQKLRQKIIAAVGAKGALNIRDLIIEVGSYDQDTLIMRTVKQLGDQEIVSRDSEGRVVPGKNWQ
jgi:hypothetical protein